MYVKEVIPWTWSRKAGSRNNGARLISYPYFDTRVNRLFEDWVRDLDLASFGSSEKALGVFNPSLNLLEKDKAFEVSVELPGIEEKDIQISLEEGVLTIQGEKKNEVKEEKKNVYRMERSYGSFLRTISLPSGLDEGKIEATFDKGVLIITLPKTDEAKKEVRRIPVKAA